MPKDGKVKNKNPRPKQSQQAKNSTAKQPSLKKVTTKGTTPTIKSVFDRQKTPNNQTHMQSKTYKDAVLKELEWQKQDNKKNERLKPTSEHLKQATTPTNERLKPEVNPNSPNREQLKQDQQQTTPTPSAKNRTPPSLEREPEPKKPNLTNLKPLNMEPEAGTPQPTPIPPHPPTPATHYDLQQMELRIIAAMGDVKTTIKTDIANINTKMDRHADEMVTLRNQNNMLRVKVSKVEKTNRELNHRLCKLENKLLEKNLVIRGVKEVKWEHNNTTWQKVIAELSETVVGDHFSERIAGAEKFSISSVQRLGPRSDMVNRPIRICLNLREDAEYLVKNRKFLKKGIYLDYEYTEEVERERRLLRPLLRAARDIDEFKGKCRLEGGELVIKSKRYNSQTLHTLPAPLTVFKATSKTTVNGDVTGFFGELNPLSNFHQAPFTLNNINFHSSEQYIQYVKAQLFKDNQTSTAILASETAFESKQLARDIVGYNRDEWLAKASELSKPGIMEKFRQNPVLCTILANTGNSKLVESSKDRDWGTGIPLNDDRCLLPDCWANQQQGILGILLEEIRSELNVANPRPVETLMEIPTAPVLERPVET